MEQPKEHSVSPAIANLNVWQPDDRIAWIDVCILVQHIGEHLDGDGIAFTRRAVDQFWC